MQFTFGKRETQIIKGIAIIAMFYHHFFGFSTWRAPECDFIHTYIGEECLEVMIASFCKICVGIYAFVSGCALFVQDSRYHNLKSICKRALCFLGNYWFIFLIFILFGILFNEPFPPVERFLLQCFGISTATGYKWAYFNAIHPVFAWYVSFYLLFLFLSPLLARICRHGFIPDLLSVSAVLFGGSFFLNALLPGDPSSAIKKLVTAFATWGHIGMIGYLFAKYNVFSVIHNKLINCLGPTVLTISLVAALGGMVYLWSVNDTVWIYLSDSVKISYLSVYTPIFIYAVIYVLNRMNCRVIDSILIKLSKESTNMWFLHGLFFTPNKTIQWIAYLPKHPIIILIWTLLLMYCCSVCIRCILGFAHSLVKSKAEKKVEN